MARRYDKAAPFGSKTFYHRQEQEMLNTDQAIQERRGLDLFTGTIRDGPCHLPVVCGHPVYNARGVLTGSLTELAQHLGVSLDELGPITFNPEQHALAEDRGKLRFK